MSPAEIVQRHGARRRARGALPGPPEAGFAARAQALTLTAGLIVVTFGVGWLVWTVVEWRQGRTASFRRAGLRVVRRSDGRPIGLWRSVLRNGVCCTLLLVPTVLVCACLAFVFVMGASPPPDLLSKPRAAPWDRLTGTMVVDERVHPRRLPSRRFGRLAEDVQVSMN
jgi:uncharacterized RDD family membrane protein YckC